jgi:hypothetical protein
VAVQGSEVHVLDDVASPKLGEAASVAVWNGQPEMTLGEIQNAAMGIKELSAAGLKQFRARFIKLAKGLNNDDLKESAMMMEQSSSKALKSRRGLKLIFTKLDELIKKTKDEAKLEKAQIETGRAECQKNLKAAGNLITDASAKVSSNNIQGKGDHQAIMSAKTEWAASRDAESKVQTEVVDMLEEREDEIAAAKQRIDERNKAIDVMVKATFIVCEKFNRFKNTVQCKSIKSRPDVNEPGQPVFPPSPTSKLPVAWRNSTEIKADKAKTKAYEASRSNDYAAQYEKDEKLEGSKNPENLPMHTVNRRGNAGNDERMLMESDDETVDTKLDDSEKPSLKLLQHFAKKDLKPKYSLPLTEPAIAISAGKTKKAKNIVEILLDVKGITEDEQRKDKIEHNKQLDAFYKRSWSLKNLKNTEEKKQAALVADMEERRLRMKQLQKDTEEQNKSMRTQNKVRTLEEDRCEKLEDEYGQRESIRQEDLENIAKLISLLRSLYDKKEPVNCLKSEGDNPVMCTHKDNGWCIWKTQQGTDQRCSCNVGYYGDLCENKMCPGSGEVLFKADQDGVCSNHGKCDSDLGACTKCSEGYYNGPKKACELKHCPASKNGAVDELCSENGTCDKKRGKCTCKPEWSGPGCQHRKCPNSNGVLYPFTSANACDGRGACSVETGKCTCNAPYKGKSCELSNCPRDCSSKGGCNEATGKCQCPNGLSGVACEFVSCPDDCSGGGECNRLSGKCICKMGYSGPRCRKATRCPVTRGDSVAIKTINWYTVWDKPGWITCPPGQSIHALRRSSCDALECLEAGSCAAPCEGQSPDAFVVPIRHCYHDLNVYASMDKQGWSKCEANYFVSGLYRSGNSLYNLQMFKCCSYKGSRWASCGSTNWAAKFNGPGWVKSPEHKFISGLYRGKGHRLRDIDQAYTCGWVRGY